MSFVVKAEQDILTPSTDDRKYRYIVLENGLKVLLISDAKTDKCAACCSVQVGSMSDPPEAQGLAHFLEHMLFMGTEKYPEENEYSAYLNSHGGYSNAYTDVENTVYYFDVQNDHFEGALDRFAAFFSCPLFTESSTDREIQAVDSENSKNLQSDMWRIYQLFKNFSRPDHPLNSFSTGNKVTLGDVPKAAGTNIRDLMIAFYRKHYSANLMNVTIYGHDSLDQLQSWAVDKFSSVPNQHITRETFPSDPFRREQLGQFVEITPVRDMRYVEFFFPMPSVEYLYRSKPHKVLAHLIGHESDGSILAALKKKMWANSLSASPYRSNKDFACFGVSVSLTEQGLEHVQEVIAAVFAYAGMLVRQGIPDWVWQELKETGDMQFRFQEKKEPSDYAVQLAAAMDVYAPSEVIAGHRVFFEKDVATTTALAQCLQPENALIFLYHKGTAGKTTLKEKWYGTPYSARTFTPEETALWQQSYSGGSQWDGLVSLPQPNPFVPTDFTLKSTGSEKLSNKLSSVPPKLIDSVRHRGALQEVLELQAQMEEQHKAASTSQDVDAVATQLEDVTVSVAPKDETQTAEAESEGEEEEEGDSDGYGEVDPDDTDPSDTSPKNWNQVVAGDQLLLWHRLDSQWQMPKVCTVFALESNFCSATPWNVVMTDLLSKVLSEHLNEFAYYADCVGLYFDVSLTKGGLQFRVQGYGHKLPVLVERVAQELQYFATDSATTYNLDLFQRVKDCMVRSYKNQLFSQPYYHSMLGVHQCLEEPRWGIFEKLHALQLVNLTSLQAFAQQFLSQMRIEAFMNGNITSDEAKGLMHKVHDILKTSHLPYALQPLRRALALPAGYDYLYRQCAQVYNPSEVNSASSIFYLFGEIAGCPSSNLDVGSQENLQAALILEAYRNLFVRMMSEPAFDQLRTKEQLGYMVYVASRDLAERQMAIAIIVQSSVQDPVYLDSRIDAFLLQYRREVLGTMDEATLQTFIAAEIEALLEKPKNLDEETRRYWDEISKGLYLFDRDQRLVQLLQTAGLFTVASMQACFDQYFDTSSPARTTFSSQFFGKDRRLPRVPEIPIHVASSSHQHTNNNNNTDDKTLKKDEVVADAERNSALAMAAARQYVVVHDPMEFKRALPLLPARNYLATKI